MDRILDKSEANLEEDQGDSKEGLRAGDFASRIRESCKEDLESEY